MIHNPSNLYSNGQYKIDSTPFTKLVLGQEAKKKAAKEAVNKSMTDLMSKINIAGVRQQDLDGENGGILKDIENWKKNSMANKDAILKGGEAQQRQMLDYQTLLHNIQKSKDAAKRQLEIGKANAEGKLDLDDEDLPVLDNMNQSIYNPAHYKEDGSEYGWNDLPANLPKFTPEKQDRFFNVAAGKNQPTYDETKVRVDNVTGKVFIPQGYAPEQIKEIAINSGNVFDGSPEAKRHYKKQLSNPQFMGEANTAFKTVFGKDIESPREAAQADAIMRAASANKEIQVTDPNYANKLKIDAENRRNEEWRKRKKIDNGYIVGRMKKRAEESGVEVNNVYNNLDQTLKDAESGKIKGIVNPSTGKLVGALFNDLNSDTQGIVMKSLKDAGNDVEAADVFTVREPDGAIGLYRTNDAGQPIPSIETRLFTLSRVGVNLKAKQPGAKENRKVISQGEPNKKPAKKISGW